MSDALSGTFAALSDPTRRGLYEQLLGDARGATATELAARAHVSRQAIVKHLQVLVRGGLAVARRDGREVRYVASTGGAQSVATWLNVRTAAWQRRVAALKELAAAEPTTGTGRA